MDFLPLVILSIYFSTTIFAINFVWKCWKKEASLPQACHYENLTYLINQSEKKMESLETDKVALKAIEKEKAMVEYQIPILQARLQDQKKELANLADEKIHAKIMIQDFEEKIIILNSEDAVLTKKIKALSGTHSALEAVLKEKKILDNEVSTQKYEVDRYLQQTQQYQSELLTLSAERKKQELIKVKIEELKSELLTLSNEYSLQQAERKDAELKVDELQRIFVNLKEITISLDAKTVQQQASLSELKDSYLKSCTIANDLNAKIAELTIVESTLVKRVALQNEELKLSFERDADLKIMMEKRIHELSSLDEAIKHQQNVLDGIESTNSPSEETVCKVLTRPYLFIHTSRPPTGETDALKCLEHYLQNEGLNFEQRTLYRFHTSLKVTSHCPLVILSGISGTGKTLLAQSYASACGLHFLPMAVQPRWDSPQDLFGYYDFTKKQFAATELSRSLLQMDHYNRNQWLHANTPPQWIDDNLMMVLIDEMNIARVEHYFSELLSKLELRRNTIFTDNNSRRIAEIGLGNCILPATDQEISLFIDYNILFVGTLNEDETTLALSDKILDRANVIHFGKPDSFSQKKKGSTSPLNKNMLSYETWKGWIKNDSSIPKSHKSEIDTILNDFNKHMGNIGRPTGHRTYQAIIAYIANYPSDGSQESWKQALADQVEQKLMTRLRGIDLSSHHNSLSEIESLVKVLEDDKLSERYSLAKESSYFEWK